MLVIGELINASRKQIKEAIQNQDISTIQKIAQDQRENGADYIDVNAGVFVGQEKKYMNWLIETVQEVVEAPCCIDSPDPQVVESALDIHKGSPIVNSISLEKERYEALLPIITQKKCKIVALCMSDKGMPETAEDRFSIAENLVTNLVKNNIPEDNIYVDPLVQPISTNDIYGKEFLKAIEMIMTRLKGVHTICGLSNISYGLPKRILLNQTFMTMAIEMGLDAAIINPMDRRMMATIYASETLIGKDSFCMNYLDAYRSQKLEY